MERLNLVEIETVWGFKSFELWLGDINRPDEPLDLMAVSVLKGDYYPLPGSVAGALFENHRIDLARLLSSCRFDLRVALCCWVSEELSNLPLRRILCVELLDSGFTAEDAIQNVFVVLSMLEAKGIKVRQFALPLLGAGYLALDSGLVIRTLLRHSLDHMRRSQYLRRIRFVAHDEDKAKELSQAMDHTLGRVRVVLPKGACVNATRKQVLHNVRRMEIEAGHNTTLFGDLRRVVSDPESRAWQLGLNARKLLEYVVDDILGPGQYPTLSSKLDQIKRSSEPKIAGWMWQYMQVLREIGNETVHVDGEVSRVPATLEESDLEICLLCLNRLLKFWLAHKERFRTALTATVLPE